MDTTVTLNKRHFKAAADKARQLGKTPQGYIESLIDAAATTFEDILRPVHKSKVSEEDLDAAIAEARKAINKPKNRKARK